ncbi:MAG TPA: hypothetical protein VHN17_08885 [Steroidobacteraceae bacterium]|jgi:hypothetical protein|nr:hypothetical protein [Steroidobacteraceae bacterium]
MKIRLTVVAALSAVTLSLAPLAPAMAADPVRWIGGSALGHFGLGAVLAHTFLGFAALPLVIAGAVAAQSQAAQSQDDRGYGAQPSYGGQVNYGPPAGYYAAPPAYYATPPAYYGPRAAYYAPAPRYYAPPVSYYGRPGGYSNYGRPAGYYGARPGYYAPSGYQAARRSGYYHYAR